jgi:acetyltransferase-like isoleucine patch superfamily enzyme
MEIHSFETPWKITNNIRRFLFIPFVLIRFRLNNIRYYPDYKISGLPIIQKHRNSTIQIGRGLQLRSFVESNPLGPNHPVILCTWSSTASLIIGDNFGMTGGSIVVDRQVIIGNRVNIGANSTIADTDFHPIRSEDRKIYPSFGKSETVVIEDDVFIGMNCLILKGVTIGNGSVIGAGSVVSKSIPSGVIAAGNPAQVIRTIT